MTRRLEEAKCPEYDKLSRCCFFFRGKDSMVIPMRLRTTKSPASVIIDGDYSIDYSREENCNDLFETSGGVGLGVIPI
jgi:hypothetical protein